MKRERQGRSAVGRVRMMSLALAMGTIAAAGRAPAADDRLELTLRSQVASPDLGGEARVLETSASWAPKRTAIIVCDMWDLHSSVNASRRVVELAPRIDAVLKAARERGVLIIHAPSDCMSTYEGHPARERAKSAPRPATLPAEIGRWCRRIPAEPDDAYPVDQVEGGDDDDPAEHARWVASLVARGRNPRGPWKAQNDAIAIEPAADIISDKGEEIWSVLEAREVENVILMGVHLNMCVLGRPFGLRQMARNGKNVALMRDLTDTMYDPRKAPFVSHFTGTDRMIAHVERYVAPTLTSDQIVGGEPFRFRADTRPHVVFLIAEDEYRTETTLPPFAAAQLGKDYRVSFVFDSADDKHMLTGLSALENADLLVVSARRRLLPADQVAEIRRYVASGRPVVGLRTASHGLAARPGTAIPPGRATWDDFDPTVLGGHYTGHHKAGLEVAVAAASEASSHPILVGVDVNHLIGKGSLYKVSPLADSATPLLTGTIPGASPEPIAWTNLSPSGGRVVYTSLGHVDDFAQPAFRRLLRNAIDWAAGREVRAQVEESPIEPIPFPRPK